MKKFVMSLVFILAAFFAIDRVGGVVMWWVNQHSHDLSGPKIKYLASDAHEDVVLLGTSRCNLHYVPSIISDSVGMSVYNGGIDASNNIYAHYVALTHILSHHTPKVVCLDLLTHDFSEQEDPFKTITFFAPYFGKNEQADSLFREAGIYWKCRLSHLYRFNAKASSNIVGLLVNRQVGEDHGYIPARKPRQFPCVLEKFDTPTEIDGKKLEYVRRFVDLCRQKSVKLVFVVSPRFTQVDSTYYDVLKEIARKNDVPFLDYHTSGLYQNHPEYFKDASHLWDMGARLYSSVFASDLKRILNP